MPPPATLKWLRQIAPTFTSAERMRRGLIMRMELWRDGEKAMAIPGYDSPPPDLPGSNHPAGWDSVSFANLFTAFFSKP